MIKLRPLDISDLPLVCRHREAMFAEAGSLETAIAAMRAPFAAWLEPRLADGRYFGFIAETDGGEAVGGVGLMEIDWPPHPSHPVDERRGYVLNVYVEPSHRGQGLARALMDASDDAFRARKIPYAILHATAAGRPLYERNGWSQTSEMAKRYSLTAID